MTLSTYRNSPYWKAAIDLGPALARLADELPASEEVGLSKTLRQLTVDLPAAIAADILFGTTERRVVALKLVTALELVDHIYPALDTAATRTAAEGLAEELLAEDVPAPAVEAAPVPELPAEPVAEPVLPTVAAPSPVPLVTAPVAAPVAPVAPVTSVPVVAAAPQESHVQSDSQE